ncbi:hypothetical protein [Haloglycomyces albus]|uniref:hypothetical protein n=1 Tax=Haloglycomyces albus TaxID=526067 RepID=UPI00046D1E8B|nr:hypothetical protein [Haloglycomyces albus]
MLELTQESRTIAGIVLLTVVTIEFGGTYLLRVARGQVPLTEFQTNFHRAGHAHAGVLVTLGLVGIILADATGLEGILGWIARAGVPISAIFIPAGFFLSSLGKNVTRPNGLIVLLWIGTVFLAVGTLTLGIGLLTA